MSWMSHRLVVSFFFLPLRLFFLFSFVQDRVHARLPLLCGLSAPAAPPCFEAFDTFFCISPSLDSCYLLLLDLFDVALSLDSLSFFLISLSSQAVLPFWRPPKPNPWVFSSQLPNASVAPFWRGFPFLLVTSSASSPDVSFSTRSVS